jgi:hypothetical protein
MHPAQLPCSGVATATMCVRPTRHAVCLLVVAVVLSFSFQNGLLSKPTIKGVDAETQRKERSSAFDLLDALSKSGACGRVCM